MFVYVGTINLQAISLGFLGNVPLFHLKKNLVNFVRY